MTTPTPEERGLHSWCGAGWDDDCSDGPDLCDVCALQRGLLTAERERDEARAALRMGQRIVTDLIRWLDGAPDEGLRLAIRVTLLDLQDALHHTEEGSS